MSNDRIWPPSLKSSRQIDEWGENVFRGSAKIHWKSCIAQHRDKATSVALRDAFARSVREEFQLAERQHLLPELRSRYERGDLDKLQLIAHLRNALAASAIEEVRPDLVIFDEFQKFRDLLDPQQESAQRVIGRLRGDGSADPPALLLLSATPYRLFTRRWEEEAGPSHRSEFFELVEFLYGGDSAAQGKRKQCEDAFIQLETELRKGQPTSIGAEQACVQIEEQLCPIVARTERASHPEGWDYFHTEYLSAPIVTDDLSILHDARQVLLGFADELVDRRLGSRCGRRERARGRRGRQSLRRDKRLAAAHGRDLGEQLFQGRRQQVLAWNRNGGRPQSAQRVDGPQQHIDVVAAQRHLPALGGDETVLQVVRHLDGIIKADNFAAPLIEWAARISDSSRLESPGSFSKDSTPAFKVAKCVSSSARNKSSSAGSGSDLSVMRNLRTGVLREKEPLVKAESFGVGANDYLVKLPDRLELVARVRDHSKGYIAQLERNEAYRALAESRQLLSDEIAEAAKYVRSLLPDPLPSGPARVDWRFVPCTQLGGDSFSYHWLDDEHFAVFLLDVSGHGVGSSLMSISALNILRSQALPRTDFRDPGQVLAGLNAAFGATRQQVLHHLVRRVSASHAAIDLRRRRAPARPAVERSPRRTKLQ